VTKPAPVLDADRGSPLDLSADPSERALARSPSVEEAPYDPTRDQENVRANVAYGLLGTIVAFMCLALFGTFLGWIEVDGAIKLAAAMFSPVIGLFGAVMGFYFGERRGRQQDR
jgi:hypothetical protein